MNELSLFSGAGGGLLGTKLLGFKSIGYVEFNDYCQRVLVQRIEDGFLDEAPIFTDVRAFASIAEQYRGVADVVTAGFPCQPFSVAGKQAAADDERNMWPATIDIIRAVKPRYAFLENVPGLLSAGEESEHLDNHSAGHFRYIYTIFRDLAEAGYDARWCVLGADDCGAPHRRKRLWIVATNTDSLRGRLQQEFTDREKETNTINNGKKERMANSESKSRNECQSYEKDGSAQTQKSRSGSSKNDVPNTEYDGSSADPERGINGKNVSGPTKRENSTEQSQGVGSSRDVADTNTTGFEKQHTTTKPNNERSSTRGPIEIGGKTWWSIEPELGRVANGVANRVDRLKAIGNGQVSIVAATAWRLLNEQIP